ncbi:MAG: 50S ribosomal protein L24 [Nitrospiria bacterium]
MMKRTTYRTRIRKGDLVRVITGKEKGKEGEVLHVFPKKQAVYVESLNLLKRAVKPSQSQPKGGIVEREGRMHLSNVMLVCRSCNKQTRIGKKILPDGKKLRICKRCGDALDKEA